MTGRIYRRSRFVDLRTRASANRICDLSQRTKRQPDAGLTDIRRAGKIKTIQTTDKSRRVKQSRVSCARITALIRDNRVTLPRIKDGLCSWSRNLSSQLQIIGVYVIPSASHAKDSRISASAIYSASAIILSWWTPRSRFWNACEKFEGSTKRVGNV